MNRAEAHDYMWYKNEECPSMRWGNHATIRDYVDVMIDEIYDSFEEQIQGLQSLLDLKQQEISVLESQVEEEAKQAYIQGSKDSHEAWKKTLKKNFGIEL